MKKELEAILEKEVLPASIPEFPIVRRMTLGMNSSLVVPSPYARTTTEERQKEFTDGWDPLFIGYTAAIYFHTSDAKINSWTTQAKKMRGSMPPKFEVRDALRVLERASLENQLPAWDDGRMIVNEGHIALKADEMLFATRRYRAPYGLEQVERNQEGKKLDAAGPLYVALTEHKGTNPTTPTPLSVDTPGDKRSGTVEDRFKRILERREAESGDESMDETLSEAGEDMEVGNTPEQKPAEEEFTAQELLEDLSEENWAGTPTPPLTSSPRKDPEMSLTSENPNMGMIFLSAERREKNTFEGNRDAFLGTLNKDAWQEFLSDFNREVDEDTTLDNFKEELWDTVVKFGEPVLMGTGLEEKARGELLSKMVELRKTSKKTREDKCKDSSTPKQKTDNKIIKYTRGDKVGTSNMIKSTNILKARAGGRQELVGEKEVESVMITTTPPNKDVRSRKRKRDVEGLGSPSADAVSEKDLRETAPMVLARWKTAAYKSSYEPRKLLDIEKEMENPTSSVTEEDFKPQRIKMKRGSTSGQTWEVDVGKEWVSSEHQAIGKQVTSDPLEKNKTRNTSRPWWIALGTLKEMEDCLKKLNSGVARKRHSWATQQKAEVNKIELANQLKRSWQNLLKDHFEEAMRTPSSAPPLMANTFIRTAGQLMFAWSLLGIELETLTSYDKLKLGGKNLEIYRMLMQHVARDNSGLSLARRKDATCFLRWTMSMMTDSTILACHQKAVGSKTLERRVSTVILNVYQSTGIEREDGSRQSLESHRKLDEIRRFYNKKFEEKHDVHRNLASTGEYLKLNKKREYQYVSGVMGMAYNPFLDLEAGGAHRNYEVAELLKVWTEKIMEIDTVERERPSLGLILERTPEVISVPRSSKRVELKMGNGNGVLTTNLEVVWKLLRPSWCPHPHASLIEEVTERVRLAPTEDEDLATLSIVHRLILPQMKESSEVTSGTGSVKRMEPGSCLDSTCGNGEHTCDGRSCVRIQSFQKEDLITWFEDITEREKSEIQIVAEFYASTTVNLATALGFFSRMCSLQSLERLESEHHLVTALSVESWPGVLQVNQKHIKSWKIGLEAEMGSVLWGQCWLTYVEATIHYTWR